MREQIFACIFILFVMITFLGVPFTVIYQINKYDCKVYNQETGRPTKFNFGQCYVKYRGTWYAKEEMKTVRFYNEN